MEYVKKLLHLMLVLLPMQLGQEVVLSIESDREWSADGLHLRGAVDKRSVGSDLFALLLSSLLLSSLLLSSLLLSSLLLLALLAEALLQESEALVQTSLSALKTLDLVVGATEAVDVNTKTGVDRVVQTNESGQKAVDTLHCVLLWFEILFGGCDESRVCRW
jgi:hypothetical protein